MFAYLGVLISIILGLALTHLLVGLSKVIQLRHSAKPYWVHILWTIDMLIYVLAVWWGMFWWNGLQVWTIEQFLFIAIYSSVLFLLATMLFPWDVPRGIDFEKYFFANKSWFFGIQIAALLLDIPETLEKGVAHVRDVPLQYVFFIPAVLIINVIAISTNNRLVHVVLPVAWLTAIVSYLALTSLARIGGQGALIALTASSAPSDKRSGLLA